MNGADLHRLATISHAAEPAVRDRLLRELNVRPTERSRVVVVVHAGAVADQEFHKTSTTRLGRLAPFASAGVLLALAWWDRSYRWMLVAVAVLVVLAAAVNWVRWRGERCFLSADELRRESPVRSEVLPLDQISAVEYPLSPGRIPRRPRLLWLTAPGATFLIGHPGSWRSGEWESLTTALAPWMVRAAKIDAPARRLLTSITGCVADPVPDGRPITQQPAVNRHPDCPRPDLCDPHHRPGP